MNYESVMNNVKHAEYQETVESVKSKRSRFSKKKFDTLVEEIIDLKEKKKAIETRLKECLTEAENMYKYSADVPETIVGDKYEMTKIPRNSGRNDYSVDLVREYMSNIPVHLRTGLIKVHKVVDPKVLDSLVKLNILSSEQVDKARNDKWTFSSKFKKHINTNNIINFVK